MKGPQLRTLPNLFAKYELRTPSQVKLPDAPCAAIDALRSYPTFACCLCGSCLIRSDHAREMHMSREHKQKPAQQIGGGLVAAVPQVGSDHDQASGDGKASALEPREQEFFELLDEDTAVAELDGKAEANIVHGFGSHRGAHAGLEEERDPRLDRSAEEPVLEGMDEILSEAHGWCFDGPECMLTWLRQLALSRFHTASTDKARGFDLSRRAHEAWKATLRSSVDKDRPAPKDALSVLSMALVCHEPGGNRSSSPLLSLIAMLSIKPRTKTWKEPGNLNSCLSGLIWVVQLLIFAASVYLEKSDAGGTLEWIEGFCEKFPRPDTETPMGEILG
ncbi:hypothetical protein VE01_05857 [Pseudogymnoascus verrucosus]|uniref:Uncharacterized protein n=1 Tax=Pseudogymnoascus verrucosus TaxID=342668 RepID=A0A1B8GKA1_9PEZI|nr:uncharacterized protein VE01_05857 [Pseudogymnoascus verrucosus]OBT96259.1 hypothetical protein VE01_05857 [Pseudogymnoascus verrucosus]